MEYQGIREYQIKQRAKNIAETPWLILPGENKLTRRSVKFSLIRDHSDPTKFVGVHAEVLFQKRKNQSEAWPSETVNLATVRSGFGFKFSLDSAQTYELAQALQDVYPIGTETITSGKRTVLRGVGKEQLVITEKNKASILRQLSKVLTQDDVNAWILKNLDALPTNLAIARLYHDRKSKLQYLKKVIETNSDERFWQTFLKQNPWMLGNHCVEILAERRVDIQHEIDFPVKTDGGFMDIVEIKKPGLSFWTLSRDGKHFKYRGKFLIPHPELQGALAQTTKYILQAEKQVDSLDYINAHGGLVPLKPRGLVIHGRSKNWGKDEWESFRLLNDELHSVQVITFDHLLHRAERMLAVMEVEDENPPLKDIRLDDIPF